jgi:DNA-binding PadR family transcriptional regulator
MDKELLKGNIDLILLIIISYKTMYGYEIGKEIRKSAGDYYELGEGTMYIALKRLEDKEFASSYWEKIPQKNIRRKYYKITKKGEIELKSKLESFKAIYVLINKFLNDRGDDSIG